MTKASISMPSIKKKLVALLASLFFLLALSIMPAYATSDKPCGSDGYLQAAKNAGEGQWACQAQFGGGCGVGSAFERAGWSFQGEGVESGCIEGVDCCWKQAEIAAEPEETPAAPPAAPYTGPKLTIESDVFKPLGPDTSIPQIIGKVIKTLIGLTGLIALVMFITGGLRWMLAAGNQEAVGKAKKTITWAVLGLVMVFASYAIVNFVIGTLAP